MFKKNLAVLFTYSLGIVISILVSLLLGILWNLSHIMFSIITGAVTISLMYVRMWKFGKEDKLNNYASVGLAVMYILMFVLISLIFEIVFAICNFAGTTGALAVLCNIGGVWFYPFTGMHFAESFLIFVPVATFIVSSFCILGYIMGTMDKHIIPKKH